MTVQIGDSIWLGEVVEYIVVALAPAVAFCQRRGGLPNAITRISLADIGTNGLQHVPKASVAKRVPWPEQGLSDMAQEE